jgi:hypothetical protein
MKRDRAPRHLADIDRMQARELVDAFDRGERRIAIEDHRGVRRRRVGELLHVGP